jgi:hypothetical protein
MYNVPTPMKEAILKLKGLEICPNVIGQISVSNIFKILLVSFYYMNLIGLIKFIDGFTYQSSNIRKCF